MTAPSGDRLLFELYQSDDNLQQRTDELYRLFRPLSEYTGPAVGKKFVPLAQRA